MFDVCRQQSPVPTASAQQSCAVYSIVTQCHVQPPPRSTTTVERYWTWHSATVWMRQLHSAYVSGAWSADKSRHHPSVLVMMAMSTRWSQVPWKIMLTQTSDSEVQSPLFFIERELSSQRQSVRLSVGLSVTISSWMIYVKCGSSETTCTSFNSVLSNSNRWQLYHAGISYKCWFVSQTDGFKRVGYA